MVDQLDQKPIRIAEIKGTGAVAMCLWFMSFNSKKIPVLFFFSGLHTDYHKPSDTSDKINSNGAIKVLSLVYMMADRISAEPQRIVYTEVQEPKAATAGSGGGYGPYFGSVPDFRDDLKGVLFADVQNNSPAGKAGLKAGDLMSCRPRPVSNSRARFQPTIRPSTSSTTTPTLMDSMMFSLKSFRL